MKTDDKHRFQLTPLEEATKTINELDASFFNHKQIPSITLYPNRKTIMTVCQVGYDTYKYQEIYYVMLNDLMTKKVQHKLVKGKDELLMLFKVQHARDELEFKRKFKKTQESQE